VATFLQLCQAVTRESRTIAGTQPTSVVGQTGRLAEIVECVRDSWRELQNMRAGWFWLQAQWSGQTMPGVRTYTAGSFSLARWAEWLVEPDTPLTIYRQSVGAAEERELYFRQLREWQKLHDRGLPAPGSPVDWTVSRSGEILLGPTPDDIYVLRGFYRKTPQELVENGDVPEMPERFHNILVWMALMKLHEYDEADGAIPYARCRRQYIEYLNGLQRDQLPILRYEHRPFA
jgi:hypothetical protein